MARVILERECSVYVVNGEGGKERVEQNALEEVQLAIKLGHMQATPEAFEAAKGRAPNVLLQIADARSSPYEPRPEDGLRAQIPLREWVEVDALKATPGVWYEEDKRWMHPLTGKVRLIIEAIDE